MRARLGHCVSVAGTHGRTGARGFRLPSGSWSGALTDVKQLDGGVAEGLDGLYRRYATWLDRRLRAHVDADRAADVVQETYLRAAPYRDVRHPKSFLLKIALNLIRDEARRQGRQADFMARSAPAQHFAAEQVDEMMLKQILIGMPPLYRDVFLLQRFGGLSYAEIAERRGLNIKTVEWRMSKALEYCVARLEN
jgi:RNA polymerase sigma factor (sigma-70 family)